MSVYVSVQVHRAVYDKLRRLAVLTGDENSAIEKLISHWEQSGLPAGSTGKTAAPVAMWHSPTGDVLPIGEKLQGSYGGETHDAIVEAEGIRYRGKVHSSPTAAAQAVKASKGVTGTSARTNGRGFWRVRDPQTNRWIPISSLRPSPKIDTAAILARFRAK